MTSSYKIWFATVVVIGVVVGTWLFVMVYQRGSEPVSVDIVAPVPVPTLETEQGRTASAKTQHQDIPSALAAELPARKLFLYDTELTDDVGELPALKQLVISVDDVTTLPSSIGKLTNLEVLNVARSSKLATLPPEIGGLSSLYYINISGTEINTFPPEVQRLTRLQVIITDPGQLSQEQKDFIKATLPKVGILER